MATMNNPVEMNDEAWENLDNDVEQGDAPKQKKERRPDPIHAHLKSAKKMMRVKEEFLKLSDELNAANKGIIDKYGNLLEIANPLLLQHRNKMVKIEVRGDEVTVEIVESE
jgi:hypothetical protein